MLHVSNKSADLTRLGYHFIFRASIGDLVFKQFFVSDDMLNMGMFRQRITILSFALAMLLLFSIQASAMYTTYQAKIIKPDGVPLESTSVNFRFTILDPLGACILYTENFNTINMDGTGGLVYFSLGSGIKTFPVSASVNFSDVFNNYGAALSCASGGPPSYTPAANDLRKIVMQFQDGSGWQTLPAMSINYVPYAMYAKNAASATTAVNSNQLNGKTDLDFVQVSVIPTCAASQALQFNGASFACVSVNSGGGGGGGGGSITVSGTAPIMIAGSASAPVISISVASMSSDGYLTAADYAEFKAKLSVSSTQITNTLGFAPVSASAVAAQISAAAAVSSTANALVLRDSSGNIWANDVYANTAKTNYVDIFKPSTAFSIRLQAPTSLSASYNLSFPSDDGLTGQVLTTDGSGNLSWVSQTQTITSSDVVTALGYVPAASGSFTSSQWNSSGTTINYMAGNVGIGTASPLSKLDVNGAIYASGFTIFNHLYSNSNELYFNAIKGPAINKSTPGLASAPSYTFVPARDSGLFQPLAGTVAFSTSGLERLRIDTDGNIGIGTTTPNAKLNVKGTGTTAATSSLNITDSASSSKLFVRDDGNVGIGTTTPGASLDVVKSGASSYTGVKTNTISTAGNATGFDATVNGFNYSTGVLVDATSTKTTVGVDVWASVTTSGGTYVRGVNVGVDDDLVPGSALRLYGSSTGNALSKAIEISSGFNSGYAIFANTNGKSYFKGNIGIGTLTPVTALDVSGGVRISMESVSCAVSYAGTLRYNSGNVEFCNGTTWSAFGGSITSSSVISALGYTPANSATVIGKMTGVENLSFATGAGASLTAGGNYNILMGTNAGSSLTTGDENIVLGREAGKANTTGFANLFIGSYAGANNTGDENTFVGAYSGGASAGGSGAGYSNAIFGAYAGAYLTSGYQNTLIGYRSGQKITTGFRNYFGGYESGQDTNEGYNNVFIGYSAGLKNTTANNSVALGATALTWFVSPAYSDAYNTAIGAEALTGVPAQSTGVRNTALGGKAGDGITTGSDNILIGYNADTPTPTTSNFINIGNVIYGNSSTGNVGIGTTTPRAHFDVSGSVAIGDLAANNAVLTIYTQDSGSTSHGIVLIDRAAGYGSWQNPSGLDGIDANSSGTVTGWGELYLNYYSSGNIDFNNGGGYSLFRSRISVGMGTTPTAKLHIAGGTSSTAALKFNSGTLLATPQAGAVEYDGAKFYITDGTSTRRAIATSSSSGTINVTGSLNVSGSSVIDGSLKLSSMTSGSVLFAGANGTVTQDNSALYWDGANKRLGIGTNAPQMKLHVASGPVLIGGNIGGYSTEGIIVNSSSQRSDISLMHSTTGLTQTADGFNMAMVFNNVDFDLRENGYMRFLTSGTERVRVTSTGNVGIGTTTPAYKFSLYEGTGSVVANVESGNNGSATYTRTTGKTSGGVTRTMGAGLNISDSNGNFELYDFTAGTSRLYVNDVGFVGIGTTAPATALHVVGDIQYTGTITDVSDRRLKTNIEPLDSALTTIRKIKTYSYVMKNDPKARTEYGVMAQDMLGIIPNLVKNIDTQGEYYGVNYIGLIPWSIRALQEVDSETQKLRHENSEIKRELASLKEKNEVLEQKLEKILQALEQQKRHGEKK